MIRLYSLVSTSMVPIMDLSIDTRAHVDDPSRRHSLRLYGYYVYPACPPQVDSLFHYCEESCRGRLWDCHRSPLRRGIPAGSFIHQDECLGERAGQRRNQPKEWTPSEPRPALAEGAEGGPWTGQDGDGMMCTITLRAPARESPPVGRKPRGPFRGCKEGLRARQRREVWIH
jgi:hypothetical protein